MSWLFLRASRRIVVGLVVIAAIVWWDAVAQHHGTRSIHPQPAIFGYMVGVEEGEEVRKLLPRRFVPGTALVTQGPGAQRR